MLKRVDQVRLILGTIVQVRFDMVCPFVTAADLHSAGPEAEFLVVPDAGHSSVEPGVCAALVNAMDRPRDQFEP